MLGIILAMPIEACCISLSYHKKGRVYRFGPQAFIFISGIGEPASHAVQILAQQGANKIMSLGFAAGLVGHLTPGFVCIPTKIIDEKGRYCDTNASLRDMVLNHINPLKMETVGHLVQASAILKTQDAKKMLHTQTGAIAADMESYYIGKTANYLQLPFMSLRIIIDPIDLDLCLLKPNTFIQLIKNFFIAQHTLKQIAYGLRAIPSQ